MRSIVPVKFCFSMADILVNFLPFASVGTLNLGLSAGILACRKVHSPTTVVQKIRVNVRCWPLTSFTAPQKCGRYRINSGQTAPSGLTGSAAFDPEQTFAAAFRLSANLLTKDGGASSRTWRSCPSC